MAADVKTGEFTKREQIINAIAVYPDRYKFDAEVVADLTDASASYVYRIHRDIHDEDVDGPALDETLDEGLRHEFRDRIGDALERRDVERTIDRGRPARRQDSQPAEIELRDGFERGPEAVRGTGIVQDARNHGGGVPVENIQTVRDQVEILRREAEFAREIFYDEAVHFAQGKYYVATQTIELLDELISQAGD